jgi:DNA (cytosine-5)-methyltransferase 1
VIRVGSLFSGIGGLELGLEAGLASAGWPCQTVWQVEQNDYARAVLARHWPHAERYTDVRDVTASTVAPIDLLCGGFPCQDISTAGNGAGLEGARSGLFFELARIAGELRPRIVVLENVAAITARGLDAVLGTLAALGYDARWGGLRAAEVGAPHRRERWFCVCWLADADRGHDLGRSDRAARHDTAGHDTRRHQGDDRAWHGGTLADAGGLGPQGQHQARPAAGATLRGDRAAPAGETQPGLGGGPDGLPSGLDAHRWPAPPGPQHPWEPPRTRPRQPDDRGRLHALGNAVVPQCGAVIGRWIGTELLRAPYSRR